MGSELHRACTRHHLWSFVVHVSCTFCLQNREWRCTGLIFESVSSWSFKGTQCPKILKNYVLELYAYHFSILWVKQNRKMFTFVKNVTFVQTCRQPLAMNAIDTGTEGWAILAKFQKEHVPPLFRINKHMVTCNRERSQPAYARPRVM